MQEAIPDGDILPLFDPDRCRVVDVSLPCPGVTGESKGRPRGANIEILDRDELRRRVRRFIGTANFNHRTRFTPVIESRPRNGVIAIDDRQFPVRPWNTTDGYRSR